MNAWLLFRTAQLKLMQHESPEGLRKSQGELSKLIAEKWRNVDAETRKSYEDLAKQKKEEFRRAYPDYRYGPHKTKAKALKADPDSAAKAKRTSPRPNLQLPGPSGPSTRPTLSHAGPSGERAVRIVNHVPYPNQREGSSLGPAATLPTPTSATSNWSNLPQPDPSRSSYELPDAGPIPRPSSAYSYSAIPASAPASTSTFQSSMASLGASINSLAPPPSQAPYRTGEDSFLRRASVADYPASPYYSTQDQSFRPSEVYSTSYAPPMPSESYELGSRLMPVGSDNYPAPRPSFEPSANESTPHYYAMQSHPQDRPPPRSRHMPETSGFSRPTEPAASSSYGGIPSASSTYPSTALPSDHRPPYQEHPESALARSDFYRPPPARFSEHTEAPYWQNHLYDEK
ncbi:hypothetical protein JCM8202v2_005233 [Rhodotorula sphaerocarpa]